MINENAVRDLVIVLLRIKPLTIQELRDAIGVSTHESAKFGGVIGGIVRRKEIVYVDATVRPPHRRQYTLGPNQPRPASTSPAALPLPAASPPPPSPGGCNVRVIRCEDHKNRPAHHGWQANPGGGVCSLVNIFA